MKLWRRYRPNYDREMEAARLRYAVSGLLNQAVVTNEPRTFAEIAEAAQESERKVRKAFYGLSGPMTLDELACTLWAMGYRAEINLVPLDEGNGERHADARSGDLE